MNRLRSRPPAQIASIAYSYGYFKGTFGSQSRTFFVLLH